MAERLSLISDALYLEGALAQRGSGPGVDGHAGPSRRRRGRKAGAVARWIRAGRDEVSTAFPGRRWLRQPAECSDREWILEIARQYRVQGDRRPRRPDALGGAVRRPCPTTSCCASEDSPTVPGGDATHAFVAHLGQPGQLFVELFVVLVVGEVLRLDPEEVGEARSSSPPTGSCGYPTATGE